VYCKSAKNGLEDQLVWIQSRLLDLGSTIATPLDANEAKLSRVKFNPENLKVLETWIDEWDEKLPKLVNFILPGGSISSSHLHVARSVCRRAERSIVPLIEDIDPIVYQFLNRLSDYFFVIARFAAEHEKIQEVIWKKEK
jgi:cob(I)alamin adenosyltransferase